MPLLTLSDKTYIIYSISLKIGGFLMKKSRKSTFFIVLALIIALTFCAFFGIDDYYGDKRLLYVKGAQDIRWGIDIQGGVEAVFTPEVDTKNISAGDMEAAKTVITLFPALFRASTIGNSGATPTPPPAQTTVP